MQTRHVWSKWNRQTNISYSEDWNYFQASSAQSYTLQYMGLDGYYRSYSFNSSNGTFRLSNYIGDDWEEIKQQYKNEDVYFSVTGYALWEHGEFSREEVYDSPVCHRYSISSRVRDYELDIVQKTTYTKGSTSYGDVILC